jgi:hypothetical protein
MANISRNFIAGKMNKVLDKRLIPNGEYTDAMNIRANSTEGNFGNAGNGSMGVIENTRGNETLTDLIYLDGHRVSYLAKCIGAYQDGSSETIYWFVHDPEFYCEKIEDTCKLDLIVSYSEKTNVLKYHIYSINSDTNSTVLNFNSEYLITGVNLIENLLFFTDNYNPPRVININKNYANPVDYVDQITDEEILVIKKPPMSAPIVTPTKIPNESNYLETRFVCFAYRYKYEDGQYSATSQWSDISFVPNQFEFSIESMLNEGMVNYFNSAQIQYNSGGPLVVGIDLLFKQSNNNIIKVIEKLDKKDLGLNDYQTYTYVFSNSKIFTILPESELLRLYDNVPLLANAQTIMGNRIMYGNYVEGYDLVDTLDRPLSLDYYTDLISEDIGTQNLNATVSQASYPYQYTWPWTYINSPALVNIDLNGIDLIEGSSLTVSLVVDHAAFEFVAPPSGFPVVGATDVRISFTFILPTNYTSVHQMATSPEFINFIGNPSNIQTVDNACNGTTFTDQFNCLISNTQTNGVKNYKKTISLQAFGFPATQAPFLIVSSPASSIIGIQLTFTQYIEDPAPPSPEGYYELYQISSSEAQWQKIATPKSLHSNRGYEVGIVYMDDYGRSTTTLVSKNNTVNVPCGNAKNKNSIQVTIPTTQIAPYWASKYKFVIKPDREGYETIYCNINFIDKNTGECYFFLEGENARKVQEGDRYLVKKDSDGPTLTCVYATVLEKEVKESGFIQTVTGATPPAGVYMKINANSFNAGETSNSIIYYGNIYDYVGASGHCPFFRYPMSYPTPDGSGNYIDYNVPQGSRIEFDVEFKREGGSGCACERRKYHLTKTFISSADYDNMEDWFIGDNIQQFLNDGNKDVGCNQCLMNNVFQTGHGFPSCDLCTNYFRFNREANNRLYFYGSGTWACSGSGSNRGSYAYATITVYRADKLFVFETEPEEALPDVFFENELSFDIVDGYHMGNVQNQSAADPAIIDTGFFNCFSFGNGVESYKIRDSIVGRPFNLGQRVTSVSAEDYKRAHRFSDMTYSGIFNPESNVNKLNEFNLGLLNYKRLESSFGSIQILDGRETDVLVLQEDKISYVLSGKNLLSDSAAGGAITSVPEVLGTQIARTEKYGISSNPESYVHWGYDRYFTDTKRGAVIQLKGNAYSNEQLKVVSDENMSVFFRDAFSNSIDYQKLGGYDPFTDEYVLNVNTTQKPSPEKCQDCGTTFTLPISSVIGKSFCVNLGTNVVGSYIVSYAGISIGEGFNVVINSFYNGVESSSDPIYSANGSWSFDKTIPTENIAYISFDFYGSINENQDITITIGCPEIITARVVQVVVSDNGDYEDTIHAEYYYKVGSTTYPLQSSLVIFASGATVPIVSLYNSVLGAVGSGSIPIPGSNVYIRTNKISGDNFSFDPANNKLLYLYSDTLYPNNPSSISNLIAASTPLALSSYNSTTATSQFVLGSTQKGYLYLIYDLRTLYEFAGCYSFDSILNAYCSCEPEVLGYMDSPDFATATTLFKDETRGECLDNGFYSDGVIVRELVDCVLLPASVNPNCPVAISLCYSLEVPYDACCGCGDEGECIATETSICISTEGGINLIIE